MTLVSKELRDEMLSYDSCLVSDALEKLGLPLGIAGLKRLATSERIFGQAVTVRLVLFDGNVAKKHLGTAAIEVGAPGDVIVVEHQSRPDCAGWGGLLSTAAAAKGISGVVVDGMARDIDESEQLGFPVFARGGTPVTARGKVAELATNIPVDLAGVTVNPGDYVIADGSGVAVIPHDRLDEVLVEARAMIAFEDGIRAQLLEGVSIGSAMNASYETLLNTKK
ncbi:MAG: RraA family protein [Pseudomonadota bacterium]